MSNANFCPSTHDLWFQRGDYRPFTFTLRNADGTPLDITGWALHLLIDEMAVPTSPTTQIAEVIGTVVEGTAGVVEFAFSPLVAQAEAGTYYWQLLAVLPSPTTSVLARGAITFLDDACHCLPLSDVDICNLALGFVGHGRKIESLWPADPSQAAQLCETYYETAISAVLEMHAWSFATRYAELTAITSDRDEWAYAYEVPELLLRVLNVLPQGAYQDVPETWSRAGQDYAIEQTGATHTASEQAHTAELHSHGAVSRVLYTNIPNARLRYVEQCEDARAFTPLFRLAVAWHLASIIAAPLIGGDQGMAVAQRCSQMFSAYLAQARQHDTKNRSVRPAWTPSSIVSRN